MEMLVDLSSGSFITIEIFVFLGNTRQTQKRTRHRGKCCNLFCDIHIISFVQSVGSHSSMCENFYKMM